jgi:hypothetical protein
VNNYVLLNEDDIVVNIASMPKEPVGEEIIEFLLKQNSAVRCLKIKNYLDDEVSQVPVIDVRGELTVGSKLIDDTFISPRPSPDHILDASNQFWVLPYSMQETEEIYQDPVLDHEINFWE